MSDVRVLAAPDKFRGTASAAEIAAAVAEAAAAVTASCDTAPMADGGEGTLDALGGPTRTSVVTGPLGEPVAAPWRLSRGVAVIEMALASGLALAGGASGNDPVNATTAGTGELIAEAVSAGARRVLVAVGGSATTDGGLPAVRALPSPARMSGVEMIVACDVRTAFVDAAAVFGPQKGASPAQVELLTRRLRTLTEMYERDFGVDVAALPGAGAAGGLAGGLAARGASLVGGFEVVADEIGLRERIADADVAVTGEGRYDATSLEGKVVTGVAELAARSGTRVLAVVGSRDPTAPVLENVELVDLTARFGSQRAHADPCGCVREVVEVALRGDP
ncbi:MAG: glycerate kinase [Acidimicrobiaceae bacterium]|nr:glycerate kinase [Acidimicrobiaceae bacterium]MXY09947.1 glycerate kinase [Acidimicrobiaceae bacterium]MXY12040.1 glycerate kinase [Acidimicrobiaceae bacterium]MXZ67325.1 glycerate kinase [Acidimicrobiaceae bacterium]MYF33886.1 glycerate kinase [Acidimicrobiaceae bacterium]